MLCYFFIKLNVFPVDDIMNDVRKKQVAEVSQEQIPSEESWAEGMKVVCLSFFVFVNVGSRKTHIFGIGSCLGF